MSKVSQCPTCRGNIVEPAFEGDGVYPVAPMCECATLRIFGMSAHKILHGTEPEPESPDAR